uniref:Uncharacterized protein n=1 Tax=uncultured prokaryote TaxID=198431 RepID=A0A0H5Q408_9ZZZZ|nr:hypothetical protein [uncultured prokaryote]
MALYRVDTVFPMFTGDPSDIVMNTLHFEATANHETFALDVEAFLFPFWLDVFGFQNSERVNYIDWPSVTCRVFNMEDPKPRVPIETPSPFGSAGALATAVPTEVALVMSFQSQGLPGEVFQRRYNRIYLGCLPSGWIEQSDTNQFPRFKSTRLTTLAQAMADLADSLPGPDTLWVQVSNAGGSTRTLPVIKGYIDDSPDTQRRRSVDSNFRQTWVAGA